MNAITSNNTNNNTNESYENDFQKLEYDIKPEYDFDTIEDKLNEIKKSTNGMSVDEISKVYNSVIIDMLGKWNNDRKFNRDCFKPYWKVSFKQTQKKDKDGLEDEKHLASVDLVFMGMRIFGTTIRSGTNGYYVSFPIAYMYGDKKTPFYWNEQSKIIEDIMKKFKMWANSNGIRLPQINDTSESYEDDDMPF